MPKSQIKNSKFQIRFESKANKTQARRFYLFSVILFLVVCSPVFIAYKHPLYAQGQSKEEESLFVAEKAFEDGFYDVSLGLFERFLKNYPSSNKVGGVYLLIGQCYYHQGKLFEALNKFEELYRLPAGSKIQDAIIYWIAEVHFKGNDFTKASGYYQKIIDDFPKSSYRLASYYSLGWCSFQEHNYKKALEYFEIAQDQYPGTQQAQDASYKIIECLYNLQDYQRLKESIQNYLKKLPKDSGKLDYLYFYLAEADYYMNNFSAAISEYSRASSLTNDAKIKVSADLGIAWSYLRAKQYNNAQEAFAKIKKESIDRKAQDALLLGQAILNYETQRLPEARKIYEQIISETQDKIIALQAYLGKADVVYNMGGYKEAISVYKEGLSKVDSESPAEITDKLHYGLAWAYLKEGEFKSAIDEFQKVVKYSDDKIIKVAALCQIGDAYQDSGDFDKATEAYDTILRDYPDSLYGDYIQYQLGLTMLKKGNYDGAILSLQALKHNFPNSRLLDDANYALGLAYFQREDYKMSKEIFEKFYEEFKDSNLRSQSLYLWGTSLYNMGQYAQAIEVFKNIIRLYGQEAELLQKAEYEIADCYYQMGDEKEAINRFRSLRSKYPASSLTPEIIWWLGEYYYRKNDLELSRRYFSSLIQDFPKSNLVASCLYAIGSTYAQEDKYKEAIDNFQKVIEFGKSDLSGEALVAMADIYAKENNVDGALKAYRESLEDYPNLAILVYPKMADVQYKMGSYDEALDLYRKSLDIVPVGSLADIQFKIAETLQAKGKTGEAIEEYLKLTYMYSDSPNLNVKALLRVASIYENEDNFKEALKIYNKISSMNTDESKYARERANWIIENTKKK